MKSLRLVKLLTTASNNTSTSIRKHMPQYKYVNTTRIFQFCTPSCTMCNVHCARAHEYFVSMEIRFEQNQNQMHRNISYVNKYIYIWRCMTNMCNILFAYHFPVMNYVQSINYGLVFVYMLNRDKNGKNLESIFQTNDLWKHVFHFVGLWRFSKKGKKKKEISAIRWSILVSWECEYCIVIRGIHTLISHRK